MPITPTPRTTRRTKLASAGLALTLTALLAGCDSTSSVQAAGRLLQSGDSGWMTPASYASVPDRHDTSGAMRSEHCFDSPCAIRTTSEPRHTLRH